MNQQKRVVSKIYRKKTLENLNRKITYLGSHFEQDAIDYLNARLLICTLVFLGIFFFLKHGHFLAPLLTIGIYLLWEYLFLDIPIKRRAKKLETEAIFFFEVLELTLETSPSMKSAIELTATNIDSELAREFEKTLSDVKMGKSFTESLEAMKERIPSDAINNIILSLTEASIFGNNITATLRNQLDYLRESKLLETKAEITKLPTKISVISVIFFLPIMLLIVLSPVLVTFLLG